MMRWAAVVLVLAFGCGDDSGDSDDTDLGAADAAMAADSDGGGDRDGGSTDRDGGPAADSGMDADGGSCVIGSPGCLCDIGSTCNGDASCIDGTCCPFGAEGCLCEVGSSCDGDMVCDEGTCVMMVCEPIDTASHSTEETATTLTGLVCGDSTEVTDVATLEGPETDWFTFAADDSFGCTEQPAATVTAAVTVDVCVFLECTNDGAVEGLTCATDSTMATSTDGRPGCCGEGTGAVANYDCSGFGGKNLNVFVSVSAAAADCNDYDLSYSF